MIQKFESSFGDLLTVGTARPLAHGKQVFSVENYPDGNGNWVEAALLTL